MLSDEAFREQLVDYVYGTLEGPALAAFEEALAASPARRAELESMRATLSKARAGLAVLTEHPPARLRAAVLDEAWRLAVARGDAPMRRSVTNRRVTWLVPALSIAAAVAFVVLRQGDEAGAPMQTRDAVQPSPSGAPAPPVAPSAPPGASRQPQRAAEPAPRSQGPDRQRAPTAPPKGAAGAVERREAEGLGGAAPASAGRPPVQTPPVQTPPVQTPPVQTKARRATRGAADMEAPAKSEAAPAADPSTSAARAEKKRAAATTASAPDAHVAHADELAREGHRQEAAAAYRALIERYPEDLRVPAWRARLTDLTVSPR